MAARATLTYRWSDGDSLTANIDVDTSYPDAVAEATANAITALAGGISVTRTIEDDDGDGPQ